MDRTARLALVYQLDEGPLKEARGVLKQAVADGVLSEMELELATWQLRLVGAALVRTTMDLARKESEANKDSRAAA